MQYIAGSIAALGLIAGAAAAPAPQDISVVNNAKATNTLTTTYTKTKTVKATDKEVVTTTTTLTATAKAVATITTTIASGYTGVLPTSTVTLPASTVTFTAPASTVTLPASTVYVTISGSSTVGSSTSSAAASTSSSASGSAATTSATSSGPYTGPLHLEYTATNVAAVKQAQATAVSSSPTSNIEGEVFDRFVVIWLENTDFAAAAGDPNLKNLAAQGISLNSLFGVTHPSEPNYMASHGGDYFGLDGDGSCYIDGSVSSIYDLLDTKGISYGEYQEDMPFAGFEGFGYTSVINNKTANDYVRKHNPAVLYNSVTDNAQRLSTIKNFTSFYQDLNANTLPQWMFITPNMTNDGHDTSVTVAGQWSANFLQPLLSNPNFNGPKTLILLTFDENHTYTIANNIFGMLLGNAVPKSLVGTTDNQFYNHYSQISTVSANWGLPTLGRWDVGANVYDFVGQQTGDAIKPWTSVNGTFPAFSSIAFNQSYPGVFNSKVNQTFYPTPNTAAVVNGRAVLPAIQSQFAGKASSYYPGNVGPEIFDGKFPPPAWY